MKYIIFTLSMTTLILWLIIGGIIATTLTVLGK